MSSLELAHLVGRELHLSLTLSTTKSKLAWVRHNFGAPAVKQMALESKIMGRALPFPLISWVIFDRNYISILKIFDCPVSTDDCFCNIPTDIVDFGKFDHGASVGHSLGD